MSGEARVVSSSSPIFPASAAGQTWMFNVTVTTTATRLGTLITIPAVTDYETTIKDRSGVRSPAGTRAPNNIFFQLPSGATNLVWLSLDNNTTPVAVVGGPGMELQKGVVYGFYNARNFLTANAGTEYPVNAATAFQLVSATGSQAVSCWFND